MSGYHKGGDGQPKGFGFTGFSLSKRSSSKSSAHQHPGRTLGYAMTIGKRRIKDEEDYFDGDDEENDLEYQPAPGSPGKEEEPKRRPRKRKEDDDDSDDPLEAFMAGIEKELTEDVKEEDKKDDKGTRGDIDEEDDQESYFRYMEENPNAGLIGDEEDDLEYDSDGNVIATEKNKIIDPLPEIDHTEVPYGDFEKNFYVAHPDILKLTEREIDELRRKLGIKVSGFDPPKLVSSFGHFGFDEQLMGAIIKLEYTKPMPIQAQAVPAALGGRDIIGIAKTGSGKTAAYLWPLLIHIMDQKELQVGDGPIGLILAPTRELSQQIAAESKRFGKVYNINVVCAYGGGSLWEQTKACQEGAEIIVATPGRLIDLVKKKATNLQRVTMLILDEADRMFDMGFETQVKSICNHVRPDRQTLLFSATFRKRVEKLARHALTDPIRIVQGEVGEANEDVVQFVEVLPVGPAKWTWLIKRLVEFTTIGKVLIFVTRKAHSAELAANLKARDFEVGLLHGDMSQMERNEVITGFKKKDIPILVATDVAARGLDIPSIKTVINYDVARDIDTHTHRIGRTGRAGERGYAYTLITDKDREFAGHLVRNLEGANQHVPKPLLDLADQNAWFRKNRVKNKFGKGISLAGKSLGFKERPGLGSENSTKLQESSGFASFRAATSGPQTDRLAAMKAAFSSQFKSQFVAADELEPRLVPGVQYAPNDPMEAKKQRKKSRWN